MGWLEVAGVILGGLAILFLAKLAFDAIRNWFNGAIDRHPDADTATLVRKKLKDGNYRVVGGIFNGKKELESQTWEAKELDDELKAEFGHKNKIVYKLR
jgi:hypothetical protein